MTGDDTVPDGPWWRRPAPSLGVLALLLLVIAGLILIMGGRVGEAIPDVGRDDAGIDTWTDPLAVEEVQEDLVMGIIPDCAAGPVSRIVLWDAASEPLWEVAGTPRPVPQFFVGYPVEGFETLVEYREPADDETVRLVVFPRLGPPIGLRYRGADLAEGRVMSGSPLRTYSRDGWKSAGVCAGGGSGGEFDPADDAGDGPATGDDSTTDDTTLGDGPATGDDSTISDGPATDDDVIIGDDPAGAGSDPGG